METQIFQQLDALRRTNPLVHNITNFVVMNNTANALLAIGGSPMMVHGHREVEHAVTVSHALVINIGTTDDYWAESKLLAARKAHEIGRPWVLDPVGAGLSDFRMQLLQSLLVYRPSVIRGNASEIIALNSFSKASGKGVDSTDSSEQAITSAIALQATTGAIVCVSGEHDYVVGEGRIYVVENGSKLMTKVTGLGCSATAVIGGFIGLHKDPLLEALSGVALFSLAGELASEKASGPGSLQQELLDALYLLDETTVISRLNVSVYDPA